METALDHDDYNEANNFAREGLRTLAFAYRDIDEAEIYEGSQDENE